MKRKHINIILFALCCLSAPHLAAETSNADLAKKIEALAKSVERLNQTVAAQSQKIAALESENNRLQNAASESRGDQLTQSASLAPTAAAGSRPYLPEIGVIADIVANSTQSKEDEEGNDRVSVRELELVVGHDVDPYTRLDATIAFSDFEEASLEEAYASYSGLPWQLNGRVGKYRPKVGKINALHRDSLETVDEPLLIQHYFGAEGLSKAGLELAGFTPLSGESVTQQLILGLIEGGSGEDGELFGESRRSPSYYARLSNFFDISDSHSLELGGTYLTGSSNQDSDLEVQAIGADLTWTYRLNARQKLKWQSEAIFQDRDQILLADDDGSALRDNSDPWGLYSLVDLRLSERWGLGVRYDWVEPVFVSLDSEQAFETAVSPYLTFYQSEFARWRLQYQNIQFAEAGDDHRVFLQGTFAIGTHKHQIQ